MKKRQTLSLLLSDLEFDGETINFTLLEPFDKLFKHQKGSVWQGTVRQALIRFLEENS